MWRQVADMTPRSVRQAGVTLLEMLIVVAMIAILVSVGLPGFMDTLGRMSTNAAARSLNSAFSLARSEAVKRRLDISICASTSGTDCSAGSWSSGWIVFIDANEDANGDTGSVDAGDTVIQVFEPLGDMVTTATTDLLQYNSRGFGRNSSTETFKICPEDNNADNARAVEVMVSGRTRLVTSGLSCP